MQKALYDGAGSARGLMACVWQQSLQAYVSNDPSFGYRIQDDFLNNFTDAITGTTSSTDSDGWTGQDAVTAGGTYAVTIEDGPDGYVQISSTGTTNDYGAEFGKTAKNIVLPSHASDPRGRVVTQVRLDNVDADMFGYVLTDAAATTPIAGASDALADVGYIGFQVREDGDLYFVTSSANGGTTDSAKLIDNGDWTSTAVHQLAFAVNKDQSLDIGVDGVWYNVAAASISSSSLPTGNLAPRFFCTAGATSTAPTIQADCIDLFVTKS